MTLWSINRNFVIGLAIMTRKVVWCLSERSKSVAFVRESILSVSLPIRPLLLQVIITRKLLKKKEKKKAVSAMAAWGTKIAKPAELIRIYHECEDGIKKSVPRITVWFNDACQVMTNGVLERLIFLSHTHTNNGFFLFTIDCLFKIRFQKSLHTLRCIITWWRHFDWTLACVL